MERSMGRREVCIARIPPSDSSSARGPIPPRTCSESIASRPRFHRPHVILSWAHILRRDAAYAPEPTGALSVRGRRARRASSRRPAESARVPSGHRGPAVGTLPKCGLLGAQVDVRVAIRRGEVDVTEPTADHVDLDACLQQMHRGRVPKDVGANSAPGWNPRPGDGRCAAGLALQMPNLVSGLPPRRRRRAPALPGDSPVRCRSRRAVSSQRGHVRHLPPLPCRRARGPRSRSRCSTRKSAASCARAPVLYRKSSSARSRTACRPDRRQPREQRGHTVALQELRGGRGSPLRRGSPQSAGTRRTSPGRGCTRSRRRCAERRAADFASERGCVAPPRGVARKPYTQWKVSLELDAGGACSACRRRSEHDGAGVAVAPRTDEGRRPL